MPKTRHHHCLRVQTRYVSRSMPSRYCFVVEVEAGCATRVKLASLGRWWVDQAVTQGLFFSVGKYSTPSEECIMLQTTPDDPDDGRDSVRGSLNERSTTTLRWKCATLRLAGFQSIWYSRTMMPL